MEKVKTKDALELFNYSNEIEEEKINIKDLTRDMFKGNKKILDKYFRNEYGQECYYMNLLALKDLPLNSIKNILLVDFKKPISLAGYKYKPEHYMFSTYSMQSEYEEDSFKDKSRAEEEAEKRDEYKYKQIEKIDNEAVIQLIKILYKGIRKRQVIILDLEGIPGLINNAIECEFKGVSCKPSNAAMRAKINEFVKLVSNEEVKVWLTTNPTDISLTTYQDKDGRISYDTSDYIHTYQRVLRALTDITENLEYVKDIIHNEEDLFENEILNNEYLECECYYENTDDEEEEL